jgi:HlyD family secretion protein
MNRHKAAPLIAVVVVALALGAWYLWSRSNAEDSSAGVIASGTVDADQVQVASLVGGQVTAAELEEGDVVVAGDELYRIDDRALKLQVEQAKAAVSAAKVAYDEARDENASDADIAAAKAQWEQAKAAEKIARVELGYAKVSAPATGTVTSIAVRRGELASPGRTLATVTRTDSLFVRTFVSEPRIGEVAIGDTATITTDAGARVDGRITFIASEAQFTPSGVETQDQRAKLVYEVRLVPVRFDGLTPGMPVTVAFAR